MSLFWINGTTYHGDTELMRPAKAEIRLAPPIVDSVCAVQEPKIALASALIGLAVNLSHFHRHHILKRVDVLLSIHDFTWLLVVELTLLPPI